MFDLSSMLVLFAFGLVLTGVVYLGILQAIEDARQRRGVVIDDGVPDRNHQST